MQAKGIFLLILSAAVSLSLVFAQPPDAGTCEPTEQATSPTDSMDPVNVNYMYYQHLEEMVLAAWSDDLFIQPRMAPYSRLAEHYGLQPGTTPWQKSTQSTAATESERFSSPHVGLAAFVTDQIEASLGIDTWEVVTRLKTFDTTAIGAVLLWGLKDDAIAGIDYRLTFSLDVGGWYLSKLEERYHCIRGVSEDGLCL